jgi:hypothetical protein
MFAACSARAAHTRKTTPDAPAQGKHARMAGSMQRLWKQSSAHADLASHKRDCAEVRGPGTRMPACAGIHVLACVARTVPHDTVETGYSSISAA